LSKLPNGDWELADEFLDMLNQESESIGMLQRMNQHGMKLGA